MQGDCDFLKQITNEDENNTLTDSNNSSNE